MARQPPVLVNVTRAPGAPFQGTLGYWWYVTPAGYIKRWRHPGPQLKPLPAGGHKYHRRCKARKRRSRT